jgi:hypothetical protein
MDLPDGLDRLRAAHTAYLGEEENPVPFEEGRKALREWSNVGKGTAARKRLRKTAETRTRTEF